MHNFVCFFPYPPGNENFQQNTEENNNNLVVVIVMAVFH
jgi:hypothetical protein